MVKLSDKNHQLLHEVLAGIVQMQDEVTGFVLNQILLLSEVGD